MPKKHYTTEEAQEVASTIGINWDTVEFDLTQFTNGMNVEAEHGKNDPETNVTNDDPIIAGKIAWAHLKEFSDYYIRLAKMEKEAEAGAA
ncbi:MAG: hypothetical protein CO029_02455 [Candidatus Magasanikbacteria bacterium CG_4_9_14_0_2_um_filter_41_10]|uniref:Uncharacterized protein n=1 Tax=Candidatus Magasanikbacteria bacterium CG_4_10_14_0_2_um_filter_41_31 TaxID=1974639 RepID=A0A2M7V1V0_9BACT|nr:MAG: hypothetical protein AUJ37_03010 [Candidatus Magasanikbacteria bacterium CG1_02_41_34]PIZ92304.1 MAG: hypothetical protein COX83_04590 [Candidatus Magasanikbacteria bacterium CG_4_10_14_0_2_um_filter_41_31]PJC53507.1 MAG: hypothetical protein CO029_02455 [Candidatus Magasanikbacteria bacterium CG_4_9_14_0_2_um_filter_41_10]